MKYITSIVAIILLFVNIAAGQLTPWYLTGNSIASGDFLGTTNGQALDIKTESSQNINFYTNAGSGTFNNQRMIITNGGNVGINITSPSNLLHVDAGKLQISNAGTTGTAGTDGFLINQNGSHVELNQLENADMNFFTNGSQKMTILSGGNVGIGSTAPADKLHINDASNTVYTRYTVANAGTNFFRVGGDSQGNGLLQANATGSYTAFLSAANEVGRMWGNHDRWALGASAGGAFTSASTGPNSLLTLNQYGGDSAVWLQFTTFHSMAPFTGTNVNDGLKIGIVPTTAIAEFRQNEAQRMNFFTDYATSTAGSITIGANKNTGIGDFASGATDPARRLEVFDGTANTPQFRISNNITGGSLRWSDFETNSNGTLKMNTFNDRIAIHLNPGDNPAYYNLIARGQSMYTDESLTGYYPVNNNSSGSPTFYTLAVKTQDINDSPDEAGFAIYSNESTPQDRLAINADETGFVNFWIHGEDTEGPTTFRERGTMQQGTSDALSYFGLSPENGSVVLVPDYYQQAQSAGSNNAIGAQYNAKLWVESNGANADNRASYSCIEAHSNVDEADDNSQYHFSIKSYCEGSQPGDVTQNISGFFKAANAAYNYGIYGEAIDEATVNYGGYFLADNADVYNYAIYAETPPGTCTNGTGGMTDCPNAAGFFNGDVYTTSNFVTSDATLKTNIDTLIGSDASDILNNMNVYSFEFNQQVNSGLTLPSGTHYGVMAQDIEQSLPTLVKDLINPEKADFTGTVIHPEFAFKAVNYTELIPILIAGYQRQQEQIDSLVQRLDMCCPIPSPRNGNTPSEPVKGMTTELENSRAIILDQNSPNPFEESTMITWNIPQEELNGQALNAMLLFYDNIGTVIRTVKVNDIGVGSLLVYGNKLNSGVYTYSLVVSGKTISTKRMIKTNGQE